MLITFYFDVIDRNVENIKAQIILISIAHLSKIEEC